MQQSVAYIPAASRLLLWLELAGFFVLIPILLATSTIAPGMLFGSLWLLSGYAIVQFYRQGPINWRQLWHGTGWARQEQKHALWLFLALCLPMTLFTYLMVPDRFLSFPLQKPALWALIMVFYPLLSVVPQELLYRSFFFARYRAILPGFWLMVGSSAGLFAYSHIIFKNWVAPLFCLIGGLIFAAHYHQHRSLKWAVIEHAAYGCFVFTVGLGWFFYHGAMR
jgi:hypothetical protein